jgi:molybdenum cofactor cytidylyltransferase
MISAIVLAAGQSHRMGRQKLLLPFRGRPLIAKVVDELLRSQVDRVLVVIGRDGKPVTEALAGRSVSFVTNTHDAGEMLWSVRCGLAAVPEETSAVIVALGDQPGITAEVVGTLVRSFRTGDRGIVVPTYEGKRGHPLLFAIAYRDEILTRYEGRGLRALLDAHPSDVFDLEVASSGVLEDIDLPADYQRALLAADLDAAQEKSREPNEKPAT